MTTTETIARIRAAAAWADEHHGPADKGAVNTAPELLAIADRIERGELNLTLPPYDYDGAPWSGVLIGLALLGFDVIHDAHQRCGTTPLFRITSMEVT